MKIWFQALLIELCLIFLWGCSNPSSWALSSISAGELAFDSSRLRFISLEAHPPLAFEMVKVADQIETFISLNRFHFSTNPVLVRLKIGSKEFEEEVSVHEGAMRLRLSEESTKRVIQALQDGFEVGILVDGFEEKLIPGQFPDSFNI